MKRIYFILFLTLITSVIPAQVSKTLNVPSTLLKSNNKNKVSGFIGTTNSINQALTLTELSETDLGSKIPGGMRALSFGDFDNDGDLDILVSGEYEMGMPIGKCVTKIYRNDNGKFVEYPTNLVGVDSKNVGWIDIDHDGDLDIYVFGLSGYDEDYQQLNASKIYKQQRGIYGKRISNKDIFGRWDCVG